MQYALRPLWPIIPLVLAGVGCASASLSENKLSLAYKDVVVEQSVEDYAEAKVMLPRCIIPSPDDKEEVVAKVEIKRAGPLEVVRGLMGPLSAITALIKLFIE